MAHLIDLDLWQKLNLPAEYTREYVSEIFQLSPEDLELTALPRPILDCRELLLTILKIPNISSLYKSFDASVYFDYERNSAFERICFKAAQTGQLEILKALHVIPLHFTSDPEPETLNFEDGWILHAALESGHIAIVKWLITESGLPFDAAQALMSTLDYIAQTNDFKTIRWLVDEYPRVSKIAEENFGIQFPARIVKTNPAMIYVLAEAIYARNLEEIRWILLESSQILDFSETIQYINKSASSDLLEYLNNSTPSAEFYKAYECLYQYLKMLNIPKIEEYIRTHEYMVDLILDQVPVDVVVHLKSDDAQKFLSKNKCLRKNI